jgi:hypothetical protein
MRLYLEQFTWGMVYGEGGGGDILLISYITTVSPITFIYHI